MESPLLETETEECEVGEDTLSTIDGESLADSSISKFLTENEEEEESSSDSDEEETEPKLKYERLSADLKAILKKDVASCLAVHNKFLILGSHWGVTHLLDAMGNSLPSRQSHAHTITVNQVSVEIINGLYQGMCNLLLIKNCIYVAYNIFPHPKNTYP